MWSRFSRRHVRQWLTCCAVLGGVLIAVGNAQAQQADLFVAKAVSNATPAVGSSITFTIALTNNGPATATNVAGTDLLPAGLTFV